MGKDIKHEIFSNLFKGAEKFWKSDTTTSDKVEIKYTFKPSSKEV